jgi:hypothetical protein
VLTFARTPVYEKHVSSDYLSNSVYEDLEPACTSSCLIVVCTENLTILSIRIQLSSLPVNCRDAERRVALCPLDNLPAFSLGKGPAAHSIVEVDDLSINISVMLLLPSLTWRQLVVLRSHCKRIPY